MSEWGRTRDAQLNSNSIKRLESTTWGHTTTNRAIPPHGSFAMNEIAVQGPFRDYARRDDVRIAATV